MEFEALFGRSRMLSTREAAPVAASEEDARSVWQQIAARIDWASPVGQERPRAYSSVTQYSPGELSSIQAAGKSSATSTLAKTIATTAKSTSSTTQRQAAGNAGAGTSINSSQIAASNTAVESIKAAASSTSVSSSRASTIDTSKTSSSVTSSRTASISSSTTSSHAVLTVTSAAASTMSATLPSASAEAATSSTKSTNLSIGGIIGIVIAVLVGIIVVGSAVGWLYRKYSIRSYTANAPWAKIPEEITPFPANREKPFGGDDIYGSTSAPVIGSRRALAQARLGAFDTESRPESYYSSNQAGVGAGTRGPAAYVDVQGRPFTGGAGRVMTLPNDGYFTPSPQHSSRLLLGPQQHSQLVPPPEQTVDLYAIPMGRPTSPKTTEDLDNFEAFGDILHPDPVHTPGGSTFAPVHASADPERAFQSPLKEVSSSTSVASRALPTLAPISPLMASFNLRQSTQQPLAMYTPESDSFHHTTTSPSTNSLAVARTSEQKRLYGEIARTAGIVEPLTPNTPDSVLSVGPMDVAGHQPVRLPHATVQPVQPYVHGQPLSPLPELPTPSPSMVSASGNIVAPVNYGSGQEINPFDRMPQSGSVHSLAPPYTANTASTAGYPSPHYPPPSPGNMSVPGSVGGSPRQWNGGGAERHSFDEQDAYGGI